jgi:hypothetical protein
VTRREKKVWRTKKKTFSLVLRIMPLLLIIVTVTTKGY